MRCSRQILMPSVSLKLLKTRSKRMSLKSFRRRRKSARNSMLTRGSIKIPRVSRSSLAWLPRKRTRINRGVVQWPRSSIAMELKVLLLQENRLIFRGIKWPNRQHTTKLLSSMWSRNLCRHLKAALLRKRGQGLKKCHHLKMSLQRNRGRYLKVALQKKRG